MFKSKKVLITGGAVGDLPLINAAKNMGHYVVTSGNRANDIGHHHSDEYVFSDYTDYGKLVELVKLHSIRAIAPSAHDLAYVAVARASEILNFRGFDSVATAETVHDKGKLRKAMRDLGLRTPSFLTVNSEIELKSRIDQLQFPLIVKPVDLTGGNGITKISNPLQASRAFDFAFGLSPGKNVIVEEFLEGTYHGCSTIIVDQRVVFSFFDDEFYLFDPYRVSATSSPSSLEENDKFDVIQQIENFASAFNLVDGILHVQFISTAKGVYILEICRRTPGDLYPYFVEYATGVDYSKAILQGFLGETIDIQETISLSEDCRFVRFILMPKKRGVFRKITNDESFERFMIGKVPLISPGTSVEHPRVTPLQIYFFKIDSNMSCKDFLMNFQNSIEVQIDNFE